MELETIYQIKVNCVNCEKEFSTSRVRHSFKRAYKTDADFCGYFKKENPDFYEVRVCPDCGYASTENSIEYLNDKQRSLFQEAIGSKYIQRAYSQKRDGNDALATYKLALLCAQTVGDKERIIASLLQHIAWLYRYKGETEQELRFLQYSLESYIRVYETEDPHGNDARLMYLIGELHRRTGNFNDAIRWFSRVINDKKIMDAAMIRASREQWAVLREDMLNKGHDLPEEMQR